MHVGVAGRPGGFASAAARHLLEVPGVDSVAVLGPGVSENDFERCRVVLGCWTDNARADRLCAEKAISAGADYISTAFSTASFEALQDLNEAAAAAGRTVVCSMSWSPGLTNLMASLAKGEMDKVDTVKICWIASGTGPLDVSGLLRVLAARNCQANVFDGGQWREEPPGSAEEGVFFPQPVGWKQASLCRAPEVLSLPLFFPEATMVQVKSGLTEPALAALARPLSHRVATPNASSAGKMTKRLLSAMARFKANAPAWSAARVDVSGEAGGAPAKVTYGLADHLANLISGSSLTAVRMLSQGGASPGVVPPEKAFDAGQFFAVLAERGIRLARLRA